MHTILIIEHEAVENRFFARSASFIADSFYHLTTISNFPEIFFTNLRGKVFKVSKIEMLLQFFQDVIR